MKKLSLILIMLISISFCVSANEINWFDIEAGYSIYHCDSENIILEKTKPEVNSRYALCSQNGLLLSDFEYFSLDPVSHNLYNGTVVEDDMVTTSVINSAGEEILKKESHSADTLVFYLHPGTADEEIELADSDDYDEFYIIGEYILYKKNGLYGLGDRKGNFLTDYVYTWFTTTSPEWPGKIALAAESALIVADAISGKKIENICDIALLDDVYIIISRNDNGKLSFANVDTMELYQDEFDSFLGSNGKSFVFEKGNKRYVFGSDCKLKYEGTQPAFDYAFNKYIVFKDGKYGLADEEFNMLYPCDYDEITIAADNVYILKKDEKYTLVNQNRKILTDCSNMHCRYNYIEVTDSDNNYFICDFEGNIVADEYYDYYIKKYNILAYDKTMNRAGKVINEKPLIEINGELLYSDTMARIKNNITLVPIRALAEKTGFEVSFNAETKEINITKDDKEIKFTLGEKKCYSNGKEITLEVTPEVINNRTLVPLRAVSDAFGYDISWDGERRLIEITI